MISTERLQNALDKAITYLYQTQQATGDFIAYTSPHMDMQEAIPYPKVIYWTTYISHALHFATHPLIAPIQQGISQFLLHEREESGAWAYEGRDQTRIAPDFDSTACATAALSLLGCPPPLGFYALLWQNETAPTGPYYTLVGAYNDDPTYPHAKQINGQVNANILFCAGLLKLPLTNTIAYLHNLAYYEDYLNCNHYYVSPHFFIYALSRAYQDGRLTELAPTMPLLQNYLLQKLAPPAQETVATHLALASVTLLNTGASLEQIEPYLTTLLTQQRPDGSWPMWAIQAGYRPNRDGSPAMTTALAIEAMGKYLRVCQ